MGFNSKYHIEVDFEVPKKLQWYYAPAFAVFWFVIYLSLVNTQINHMPKALSRNDEAKYPNSFIAQRAEDTLIELTRIGPRVVGSFANENTTVEFLIGQIEKIQAEASDYYIIEYDVQHASGAYMHWSMVNMYQDIQNVIVKISAKDSTNENYLLLNSHYDSVPYSPGAGDDGSMVATMLEVLRVIAKTQVPLDHPIVFLFNGAEENPLQASHAFITQHKWAKNCKALINLDSAGSGGREILFQSGPNHPWLMNYYRKVPHPFANTMAEEFFQAGLIPSDTDFRVFHEHAGLPGLDMAYVFNGYVYHTKYDRVNVLPRASLQHTGDNVLVLAKSLANAPELDDTAAHAKGHNIFYDFLGWFMIFYTEATSIIVNSIVCLIALLAICVSLYFMSARSGISWRGILLRFAIIFGIQIVSLVLAAGLALLIAVFMDGVNKSMTYFTQVWLIIGLYFLPIFFGMGILPAIYLEKTKKDPLSLGFRIQLFMHSHCLSLILITVILTSVGIRSAFLVMLCVFFDITALILNLITKWHRKAYWFAIAVIICQVLPFTLFTYIAQVCYLTMVPMQGRSGSDSNPDLGVAAMAVLFSFLFAGFIMPLFMFFRKTRTIICCFLAGTLLFIIIAVTPAGFPYTAKTSTQRYALIHTHRRLHNADNSLRIDESGLYIYPQDRRFNIAEEYIDKIGKKHKVAEFCDEEMFCGLPLYNHRWHKARDYSYWVQVNDKPDIAETQYPVLKLEETIVLDIPTKYRFNFTLNGPDHMTVFINVKNDARILDWSFNDTLLRNGEEPPYFIYFSYGTDSSALVFTIDVETTSSTFKGPALEVGIGGHWIHESSYRTQAFQSHVDSFPDYTFIQYWVATYESWYFEPQSTDTFN